MHPMDVSLRIFSDASKFTGSYCFIDLILGAKQRKHQKVTSLPGRASINDTQCDDEPFKISTTENRFIMMPTLSSLMTQLVCLNI